MSEYEEIVKTISSLQNEVKMQREVICALNTMNDNLQAKLNKIEQIVNQSYTEDEMYCALVDIKKVLESED